MMSISVEPPSNGSVLETSEPVRYAAIIPRSLKARSCAVSFAIRINDSRVTRITYPCSHRRPQRWMMGSPPSATVRHLRDGGGAELWQRQTLLKRRQVEALPDAVLDPPEMLGVLDDVQVVGVN